MEEGTKNDAYTNIYNLKVSKETFWISKQSSLFFILRVLMLEILRKCLNSLLFRLAAVGDLAASTTARSNFIAPLRKNNS